MPNSLKIAAPIIAPALTQIFNLIISKAEFPSPLKLARVVPVHKKVPHLNIPTIGLYLYFQLHHLYWNDMYNSLFYFRQSGFREHHSCQTALIKIIEDWLSDINENKIAGSLFLDFSKAFDLVDHILLIHKLKLYNIDTSWFSSYLNKRFQQTHYAGAISDKRR